MQSNKKTELLRHVGGNSSTAVSGRQTALVRCLLQGYLVNVLYRHPRPDSLRPDKRPIKVTWKPIRFLASSRPRNRF